jgi:hypothetical protein
MKYGGNMKKRKYLIIGAVLFILLFSASNSLALDDSTTVYLLNYDPPGPPQGPTEGIVGEEYTFCIDMPDEVPCEPYYAMWDWGDGTMSEWLGPFSAGETVCANHSWGEPGSYEIRVGIKDGCGREYWSDPLTINIGKNNAPSAPEVTGPTQGRTGVTYEWTFVSTDPDGHDITYYVDWGDECGGAEWHGPYPSGEDIIIAHRYTFSNTFIINTMAMDEFGAESNWTYFEVTIPRGKISFNTIIMRLLERFPMLSYLLGL